MTTPRSHALLAALLAMVLIAPLAVVAPRAQAATSTLSVGSHVHAQWASYDTQKRAEVLDRLAAAGVEWIRVDIGWASVESECSGCPTTWHLDRLDDTVRQAEERGLAILGMLWHTPSWANDGDVLAPPDDPAEYGRAAGWLADRYRGRVDAWQVWNEPNHTSFFHGDVQDYVGLLRAAAPRIHEADPDAQVVLGAPSMNDTEWLGEIYAAGARPYFDVLATHPYMGPADAPPELPDTGDIWRMSHVESVRRLMVAQGDADKPVWFTEFGWSAHPNTAATADWQRGVTEAVQADYLVRSLEMIRTRYPYVTHAFWYVAHRDTGKEHHDGYGLLRPDLTPRPALAALTEYLAAAGADTAPDEPDDGTQPTTPDLPKPDSAIAFGDGLGSLFRDSIAWLADRRITLGCNPPVNDRYCPTRSVTREQMAAFLVRALDLDATSGARFRDVVSDSTFSGAIDRLVTAGITLGCSEVDQFCPRRDVTRAEMAAFLVRALDLEATSGIRFRDVPRTGAFATDIDRLATAGITVGCNPPSNDRFCPADPVTRGEMAALLERALTG